MTPPTSESASGGATTLGEVVIIGGGCYGSFYTGQLLEGRARGLVTFARLLVVDRDPGCRVAVERRGTPGVEAQVAEWGDFLDRYLDAHAARPEDVIVPSPFMPHLFREWLQRRAAARWPGREVTVAPLDAPVGTPYERQGGDGATYLSWADWICPTHCTEPALCPAIRAPRTWAMEETLASCAERIGAAGTLRFLVRHLAHGVGGFATAEVLAAERQLAAFGGGGPAKFLVATTSHCHAAAGLLTLGALPEPAGVLEGGPR